MLQRCLTDQVFGLLSGGMCNPQQLTGHRISANTRCHIFSFVLVLELTGLLEERLTSLKECTSESNKQVVAGNVLIKTSMYSAPFKISTLSTPTPDVPCRLQ